MQMTGLGNSKRMWLGGGAVLAVVILLAGWFLVVAPQFSTASANRDQMAAAQSQNQVLQQRNDDLKAKNGDKGALQASLVAALAQLPSDGGLPAFTRQLSAQAKAAGVDLTSVVVGAATPVGTAAGQATTTAVTTAAATPAAATASAVSTGLVQMTLTVTANGLGHHDLAFLRSIQWTGPRRALVTDVQLTPAGSGVGSGIDGQCDLTMTLTIFSAPLSPTAQAALEKLLSSK